MRNANARPRNADREAVSNDDVSAERVSDHVHDCREEVWNTVMGHGGGRIRGSGLRYKNSFLVRQWISRKENKNKIRKVTRV